MQYRSAGTIISRRPATGPDSNWHVDGLPQRKGPHPPTSLTRAIHQGHTARAKRERNKEERESIIKTGFLLPGSAPKLDRHSLIVFCYLFWGHREMTICKTMGLPQCESVMTCTQHTGKCQKLQISKCFRKFNQRRPTKTEVYRNCH